MPLGQAYHDGLGVPIDHDAAMSWWHKSADLSNADGMIALGSHYSESNVVHHDRARSYHYYTLAIGVLSIGPKRDEVNFTRNSLGRVMTGAELERAQNLSAAWLASR